MTGSYPKPHLHVFQMRHPTNLCVGYWSSPLLLTDSIWRFPRAAGFPCSVWRIRSWHGVTPPGSALSLSQSFSVFSALLTLLLNRRTQILTHKTLSFQTASPYYHSRRVVCSLRSSFIPSFRQCPQTPSYGPGTGNGGFFEYNELGHSQQPVGSSEAVSVLIIRTG